ncbi:hypothetical protein RclHR1_20530001 [Rhizophagus clarus]|uniref:Uncharacterized protein n=1 Tax=Rhizophagus clarus TaxID=94130 RepID=A0A2Z6R4T6_9GLOM|nr:hypothetical protein RclHR1_20530001 [Rhizophagus clarus]
MFNCQKMSETPIRSRPGLEIYFEANWGISKVQQTFNFKGGFYLKEASVFDSHFEVRGWIPRRNFEGLECYGTLKIFFEVTLKFYLFIFFRNKPLLIFQLSFCSFAISQMLSGWDMGFRRSTAFWTHHRRNFKGLQLPNTTGLNFEASERNFKGPRLPERLMDGISEVCA